MIDEKEISRILREAINAPSGANSQPWSFVVDRTMQLTIQLHPERDHPILNYRNRGTLIAFGCLLSNITHAAHASGYKMTETPFDHAHNTLTVSFEETTNSVNCALDDVLSRRTTNRKAYTQTSLSEKRTAALYAHADHCDTISLSLITQADQRTIAAKAFATFERLMIEADQLRKASFSEIVWSEKETRENNAGLLVSTLELLPPQRAILKLLQNAPLAVTLAKQIGLPNMIASNTAKTYNSGPILGALIVDDTDNAYIDAGKVFENIWLQTTVFNMYLQPMIGMVFLEQFIAHNDAVFSAKQREEISHANRVLRDVFKVPSNKTLAVGFRIGHADPPSALTKKAPPKITFV